MFLKGEKFVIEYADKKPMEIWGRTFAVGDSIDIFLNRDVTQEDLEANMGQNGPWGWGGFTTNWIQSIASRIESCDERKILYDSSFTSKQLIKTHLLIR